MRLEKHKVLFSGFLLCILITVSIDIFLDRKDGASFTHFATEIFICVFVLFALISLWSTNLFLKDELTHTKNELLETKEASLKWKAENANLIKGLSAAIDNQLHNWGLTPTEKEVALLLLKGLSLKEIAEIRSVSERTVRQQSINVYQKSNLSGRAELSAFFLEDLLK